MRTLVRDLLLQADRLDPEAAADRGRVTLLPGERVAGRSVAEMGLRVPEEVSLPAWDDSQLCRPTRPSLSAMSHDVHGFGAEVARTLFGTFTGDGPGSHPVPTPVLTPRGSTAPP